MTGTNQSPLKSAFKTADRPGNKRVRHGELVRTSSGHTYPAKAINQYHEQRKVFASGTGIIGLYLIVQQA